MLMALAVFPVSRRVLGRRGCGWQEHLPLAEWLFIWHDIGWNLSRKDDLSEAQSFQKARHILLGVEVGPIKDIAPLGSFADRLFGRLANSRLQLFIRLS